MIYYYLIQVQSRKVQYDPSKGILGVFLHLVSLNFKINQTRIAYKLLIFCAVTRIFIKATLLKNSEDGKKPICD